jgi:hypothetical protein
VLGKAELQAPNMVFKCLVSQQVIRQALEERGNGQDAGGPFTHDEKGNLIIKYVSESQQGQIIFQSW